MFNFACFVIIVIVGFMNVSAMSIKRSEKSANNMEKVDETEYPIKVNYDVYPLVFPKRAALLLDRLMVALHHALEDDDPKQLKKINDLYRNGQLPLPISPINPNLTPKYYKGKSESDAYYGYKLINGQADDSEDMEGRATEFGVRSADYDQESVGDETMDLQRRGHTAGLGPNKGRVYWRCYFNAVTCF